MPAIPRFLIKEGAHQGQAVELARFPFVVGRARDCDYVLDYVAISRQHARITGDHHSVYLEDLDSTNGTFVNGRRLSAGESYRLRAGDEVSFGKVCLWVFDDPATTAQISPVQIPRPGLEIDEAAARVTVGGKLLYPPLSPNQFALLALLVANAGRIVERDEIVAAVWGPGTDVSDQTIDALVSRLRRRLQEVDPEHEYIITRRGFGLLFENR
ncbi:MAG: winged helix-turn-helix domain-containing protein [Anaerolineae bacterium]